MSAQQALALPLPAASNTVVINARCSLRIEADQRVIVVVGLPEDIDADTRLKLTIDVFGWPTPVELAAWRQPRGRRHLSAPRNHPMQMHDSRGRRRGSLSRPHNGQADGPAAPLRP
jgi:hypothetical protein